MIQRLCDNCSKVLNEANCYHCGKIKDYVTVRVRDGCKNIPSLSIQFMFNINKEGSITYADICKECVATLIKKAGDILEAQP